MSCVSVQNISKTFLRRTHQGCVAIRALDQVSFTLHAGQSVAVLGPSGCGKTTLLHVLAGLVRPDQGTVHTHAPLGFVAQDPYASLCPAWNVARIIGEPLVFTKTHLSPKQKAQRVEQMMDFVHLSYDRYAARMPAQLSGGERQRVAIARALIVQPRVLLLDEPTSMLDAQVKQSVAKVIRRVADTHKTAFLMVTHDMALAAQICDRILVLDSGRIVEDAPAQQLMRAPHSAMARDLVRISTDLKGYWAQKYGIV